MGPFQTCRTIAKDKR